MASLENFRFKNVEVEELRIGRDFRIAFVSTPELQGLARDFRRFLLARAGVGRARDTEICGGIPIGM